jgi:hypothetical protein
MHSEPTSFSRKEGKRACLDLTPTLVVRLSPLFDRRASAHANGT